MHGKTILLTASILSAILCMILHEYPKALYYRNYESLHATETENQKKSKIRLYHFIDPIGLIFCTLYHVGFSKPSYYRMKEKKLNMTLGFIGLFSLIIQFTIAVLLLRLGFSLNAKLILPDNASFLTEFSIYFLASYAIICMGMLISNLFPLLSTDMAWVLTSTKSLTVMTLLKNDFLIKMIWILLVLFRVTPTICVTIFETFMGV